MICLLSFYSNVAMADTYPQKESGISVTFPKTWKVVESEEDSPEGKAYVLAAASLDEKVAIIFMVIDAKNSKLEEKIEAVLKKRITNISEDADEEKFSQDGLTGTMTTGTGVIEGVGKVKLGTLVIENKGKKILILGSTPSAAESKYEDDLETILESIKRIK